jgi:D-glycero-D-manno-heptose 1,7-bisphosphate phosphatase
MFDVILDRDGTINVDHGYTFRVEDFVFTENCIKGLLLLKEAGARFSIVTGQSGIARGKYTEEDMHKFNQHIEGLLREAGIEIAATVFCPHHPEISEDCDCRKPKTGMLKQIEQKLGTIDWSNAWGIGDKPADAEMILSMGGHSILLESGPHNNTTGKVYWTSEDAKASEVLKNERNFVAHDLESATKIIIENTVNKV